MSDLIFILYSLKARWLNSLLSVLLTASGICIAFLITQLGNHVQERLSKDGKGIDIIGILQFKSSANTEEPALVITRSAFS